MNLNTGFYKDLDTNFEQACYLSEQNFTHAELLNMLNTGNIPQKQIAALKLDAVENIQDAITLVSNLTGCDGKIREAVALKLYQLLTGSPNSSVFFAQIQPEIFAKATIDINANICRLVVDSVKRLNIFQDFSKKYTKLILNYAIEALDELDRCVFRDKKYIKNKQYFKLYWSLETLKNFYKFADENLLQDILSRSAKEEEYTVREKAAQIILLSDKFSSLQEILINDSNYYVRAVFLNH